MNIFALDEQPRTAARYHCNSHVVKMPLEAAQLLCTAHHVLDGIECGLVKTELYRPTHINHPCAVWVRQCMGNYIWTYMLFDALGREFKHRYGKNHKSWVNLHKPLAQLPENIPDGGLQPFVLAMPDEYKKDCPVESYRDYYRFAKKDLHRWTNREIPEWL